jgi:hypothetical protein
MSSYEELIEQAIEQFGWIVLESTLFHGPNQI